MRSNAFKNDVCPIFAQRMLYLQYPNNYIMSTQIIRIKAVDFKNYLLESRQKYGPTIKGTHLKQEEKHVNK